MAEIKCTPEHRDCRVVGKCSGCGWEKQEQKRRQQLFAREGLTRCGDGLHRLVIGSREPDDGE